MAPIRLRHIHLPASSPDAIFPSYKTAAAVQELLRRRLLNFKDAEASSSHPLATPHPTLISFTPQPTYTLGRRQAQASPDSSSPKHPSSLSPAAIARLKAPLRIRTSESKALPGLGAVPSRDGNGNGNGGGGAEPAGSERVFHPAVMTSPRGGLATYHGPGQVVLWPVMIISGSGGGGGGPAASSPPPSPLGHKSFTVRCYSRLLENTTTALLRRLFGLAGFTTDDPGVWVRTPPFTTETNKAGGVKNEGEDGEEGEVRKISALGIHLRRHVSSLGAAINLDMPTTRGGWAQQQQQQQTGKAEEEHDDDDDNPWARFVACGLEGRGVTCVEEELRARGGSGIPGLDAEVVARAWAEELARGMALDPRAVERVGRDEVEEIMDAAEREGYLEAVGRDEV